MTKLEYRFEYIFAYVYLAIGLWCSAAFISCAMSKDLFWALANFVCAIWMFLSGHNTFNQAVIKRLLYDHYKQGSNTGK